MAGCLLIAYLHGEPVGCGAVKDHPGEPTEIKRMWVSPSARGLGLGGGLREEGVACLAAGNPPDIERDNHYGNDCERWDCSSCRLPWRCPFLSIDGNP